VQGKHLVEVRLRANLLETGQACRVAVTDITERKRAETDRLILNKLESTGILAGGIAHDFNNLLTVVLLNLELAQKLSPPGHEAMHYLEAAKQTAYSARGLTAQLVTFATGGEPLRKAMFLSGLIQESVRPALSGSNVRCEFTLAEDLWPAEVDAGQFGQVIRNLAQNAREAMPEGGVVFVRAENVVLGAKEQPPLPAGEYVRVSITDQGVGIANDVLPNIFDPYFSTKERGSQKGMGLGLTICHAVIQKHKGAIVVDSELGAGSTFHLYLPAAPKAAVEPKVVETPGSPGHRRILVMDDDAVVRTVVGLALKRLGHEVELAAEGEMAVETYRKAKDLGRPFDVVILDLLVPAGMGGKEAIQALLRIDPAVKAVVMSGYSEDPVVLEYERYGFRGALPKPFDHDQMQGVLARALESDR
jgi:signal transduction histidine kinase/ActR/RegA family two-component response regulator